MKNSKNKLNAKIECIENLGKSVKSIGAVSGAAAGAVAGAAIGSVVTVVGTAIGAVIGGILGKMGPK